MKTFKIYSKFRSSGYDLEKTVKTEKQAISEVLKLKEKYKDYPMFTEAFYNEVAAS